MYKLRLRLCLMSVVIQGEGTKYWVNSTNIQHFPDKKMQFGLVNGAPLVNVTILMAVSDRRSQSASSGSSLTPARLTFNQKEQPRARPA